MSTPTPSDAAMAAAKDIQSICYSGNGKFYDEHKSDAALIIDYHFAPLREALARMKEASQRDMIYIKALEPKLATLRASNDKLRAALEDASETIEEMDRIHHDLMDNGPRCTCGESDEWCVRCGRSIKLSDLASSTIKRLEAALAPEQKETT